MSRYSVCGHAGIVTLKYAGIDCIFVNDVQILSLYPNNTAHLQNYIVVTQKAPYFPVGRLVGATH